MRLSVPGVLLLGLTAPLGQYLVAVNRPQRGLIAVAIAAAVAVGGNYAAIRLGAGLEGIALATGAAYGVYWAALSVVSICQELTRREACRYAAVAGLAVFPSVVLALVI
jgi:O-antigen/teichoic acid export membrane protein